MAGKKALKQKAEKSSGAMTSMLSKVFAITAILSVAVLFAAALDIGHLGLSTTLGSLTVVPLALYVTGALAAIFLAPKPTPASEQSSDASSAIQEIQSLVNSRILSMQDKVDEMSNRIDSTNPEQSLIEENAALKAELEAIHAAERERFNADVEAMRARNAELEEKIREWAETALKRSVSGEAVEPMKAA